MLRTLPRPLLLLALFAATPLAAQDIDTSPSWNGTDFVRSFGRQNTAAYGQTFTAPAGTPTLNAFSFWLSNGPSNAPIAVDGDLTFRGYVLAWNGTTGAGAPLHVSGVRSASASASFVRYDFNTGGLALVGGAEYVAFLYAEFPGAAATNNMGVLVGIDAYAGGEFVFLNSGSDFSRTSIDAWSTGFAGPGADAAFAADFGGAVVPEPMTVSLVAVGLLAVAGVARRRRA